MTVISDILDFSRLDAKQLDLRPVQFRVIDCVATALQTVRDAGRPKGTDHFTGHPA